MAKKVILTEKDKNILLNESISVNELYPYQLHIITKYVLLSFLTYNYTLQYSENHYPRYYYVLDVKSNTTHYPKKIKCSQKIGIDLQKGELYVYD